MGDANIGKLDLVDLLPWSGKILKELKAKP